MAKPLSSLLPFVALLMMILINRVKSQQEDATFIFNEFTQDSNLILQGDATYSSDKALELTRVDNNGNPLGSSVGRALYSEPIRLYDRSDGRLSYIFSSFIFLISAPSSSSSQIADGLTFFIASADTTLPPGSNGRLLGLFSNANLRNNSRNQQSVDLKQSSDRVVAVEFDTYPNLDIGDPNYRHIGIDVNSIRSVATAEWGWQNGQKVAVTIQYNPTLKTLRVFASYPDGSRVDFTHEVDLTTALPEWVRVGFSGSTGQYSQVNKIISWSFFSLLGTSSQDVNDHAHIASVV